MADIAARPVDKGQHLKLLVTKFMVYLCKEIQVELDKTDKSKFRAKCFNFVATIWRKKFKEFLGKRR